MLFDKKTSRALQGVAILLMLFHHFFMAPENLPLTVFFNENLFVKTAWFGKICVAIFTFISGYGLAVSAGKRVNDDMALSEKIKLLYKGSVVRILSLYAKMWLILVIFKVLEKLFLKITIDPTEFLWNFLGVSQSYNGSWWYVPWYAFIVILFPFIYLFFDKKLKWYVRAAVLLGLFLLWSLLLALAILYLPELMVALVFIKGSVRVSYVLVFTVGVMCFACEPLRKGIAAACGYMEGHKAVRILSGFALVLVTVLVRVLLAKDANFSNLDFFFAPLFTMGLAWLLMDCGKIVSALSWLGGISVYMWLMHIIVLADTYYQIAPYVKGAFGFYLVQLFINVVLALLFSCKLMKKSGYRIF